MQTKKLGTNFNKKLQPFNIFLNITLDKRKMIVPFKKPGFLKISTSSHNFFSYFNILLYIIQHMSVSLHFNSRLRRKLKKSF